MSQEVHHRMLETFESKTENIGFDREISKERDISPEKKKKDNELLIR